MADVPHSAPTSSRTGAILRILRLAGVGIGAGVLVAGVVGGIGGRIAMRFLFRANESTAGLFTENGNEVGVITLGGTASLVFFTALFLGIPGGLMYVLVRRWLPGDSLAHGLVYGAFLLVLFGGGAIDADNSDFRHFGPPALGIIFFSILPFVFGVVLADLVDRREPYVPSVFYRHWVTLGGYAVLAGLFLFGVVRFSSTVTELVT